jgi:hypothetical protein
MSQVSCFSLPLFGRVSILQPPATLVQGATQMSARCSALATMTSRPPCALELSDDPRMKIENRMRTEVRRPIDLVGKRLLK